MKTFSTREVAPRLRIHHVTLARLVASGKLPVPKVFSAGNMTIHAWTEDDIETARKLLLQIRKRPYKRRKKQSKPKKK
ncbi:MAG TPA: hypothetical protein VKE71_02985 [Candidatus Angelobacter sp.]|nr:hypothetical protein [Candidatus Angelobacter sp.]